MLALEFPCHFTGAILLGRKRARNDADNDRDDDRHLCPPSVSRSDAVAAQLLSQVPKGFGPQDDQCCRTDDDTERSLGQIGSRRQPRDLAHDDLQIAFELHEIGSCLIGLPQRKDVFV
jgi:hypothetical protein